MLVANSYPLNVLYGRAVANVAENLTLMIVCGSKKRPWLYYWNNC